MDPVKRSFHKLFDRNGRERARRSLTTYPPTDPLEARRNERAPRAHVGSAALHLRSEDGEEHDLDRSPGRVPVRPLRLTVGVLTAFIIYVTRSRE